MRSDLFPASAFVATDSPPEGTFQAIFRNLQASTMALTGALAGPVDHRVLAIPLLDEAAGIAGGLWGCTAAAWLIMEMLFVPECARCRGTGAALVRAAEREALARGCRNAMVDTISLDAARFFERLGFTRFATLEDFPPGHQRIFYRKSLA